MTAPVQLRQQVDAGDGTHVIVLIGPAPDQRPACAEHDPELFFSTAPADQQRALAICAGCPCRVDCLAEATSTELTGKPWGQFGIWGGKTEDERKGLRRPATKRRPKKQSGRGRRRAA